MLHRLSQVSGGAGTTAFVYDADGQRIIRREPSGATTLYLDGQELRLQSGSVSGTRYYAHGGAGVAVRRQTGNVLTLARERPSGQLLLERERY